MVSMNQNHLLHASVVASLAWAMCAGSAACSSDAEPTAPASEQQPAAARSQLARDMNPSVTETELANLAKGNTAFALDLLRVVRQDSSVANKNLFMSPTSISLALAMTFAGAEGNTAEEMAKALHFTLPRERLFPAFNALDLALRRRAETALASAQREADAASPPKAEDFRLHVVNSIWGDKTIVFEAPFLDTLATSFGAGVYLADFVNAANSERQRINQWVSDETRNRINDLLPDGSVDPSTAATIVNALHLKLPWQKTFTQAATHAGTFVKGDGTPVETPFMVQVAPMNYAETETAVALGIPLKGEEVEVVVVVPKDGNLSAWEDALSPDSLSALLTTFTTEHVSLELPKFLFTSPTVPLRTTLQALGMNDAFENANFRGMTVSDSVKISDVYHKAMVGIDEHGVEAAAATAVVMGRAAAALDPKRVVVDHPFFIAIRDRPTNTLIFAGHIADPSVTQ